MRITTNHRYITGTVHRVGEGSELGGDSLFVNIDNAQSFQAAPLLAGVLWGEDDTVWHHTDFDWHVVQKFDSRQPFS